MEPTTSDALRWAQRRTWHRDELDGDGVLRELRDTSLAVVIPALNEDETVGDIVASISDELVDRGLVDELVVVDGGSEDATVEVAEAAGATVLDQARSREGAGVPTGKGDSMWQGLAATHSELVAFIDADLRDFEASWVLALAAPMLEEAGIGLVKGLYDRPFDDGDGGREAGGGRVTELLARPLLNAFWPQLAGIAQPLAGEYAGRRAVLEEVPFVTGYGVEIGLLIDIATRFGADAIAQVDLGVRLHEHQPLDALGRMASEILAVASSRLRAEGRLHADAVPDLLQPRRGDDGGFDLARHEIRHGERPPLREARSVAAPTHPPISAR